MINQLLLYSILFYFNTLVKNNVYLLYMNKLFSKKTTNCVFRFVCLFAVLYLLYSFFNPRMSEGMDGTAAAAAAAAAGAPEGYNISCDCKKSIAETAGSATGDDSTTAESVETPDKTPATDSTECTAARTALVSATADKNANAISVAKNAVTTNCPSSDGS